MVTQLTALLERGVVNESGVEIYKRLRISSLKNYNVKIVLQHTSELKLTVTTGKVRC
jgi:hypothetical protein